MLSRNIKFENFPYKKSKKKKEIKDILKKELTRSYSLLNSFSKNYRYSFKKHNLKKFGKYNHINLVGGETQVNLNSKQYHIQGTYLEPITEMKK